MGDEVLGSVTPGQQVIKHVNDELVELLGGAHKEFNLTGHPASVMLMGLHGSGKTTTAGKLANRWKKSGRCVLLVACDIRRPAFRRARDEFVAALPTARRSRRKHARHAVP